MCSLVGQLYTKLAAAFNFEIREFPKMKFNLLFQIKQLLNKKNIMN